MSGQEAVVIHKLREYNRWRRGDEEIPQPDPFEIGGYIDAICDIAERRGRERDEAQERECAAIESWWEEYQRALREGQRVVELREQNAKLREIAERAVSKAEYAARLLPQHGMPVCAEKLRAELDQLKEGGK